MMRYLEKTEKILFQWRLLNVANLLQLQLADLKVVSEQQTERVSPALDQD